MSAKKIKHEFKDKVRHQSLDFVAPQIESIIPSISKSNFNIFQRSTFHFFIFLAVVGLNLGISQIVRVRNLYYVANYEPFGFSFGLWSSVLILAILFLSFIYFKLLAKFPIISLLVMAGAYSNFLEKWILYGNVADYINAYISQFNLADMQIWSGILVINWYVWFGKGRKVKT